MRLDVDKNNKIMWTAPMHFFSALSIMTGCLFAVMMAAVCAAQSQTETTSDTSGKAVVQSRNDSLRNEIERLRQSARELRRRASEFAAGEVIDSTAVSNEDASKTVPPPVVKDTVQLVSKESLRGFLESINGRKRTARERGFGGGFGPLMGVYAISMGPVDEMVEYLEGDPSFRNAGMQIDKPFAFFQCSGFMGYGAVGNGLRIGGMVLSGSRSYTTHLNDTTYSLSINPEFGGFLIEKSMVVDNINLFAGGVVGGSSIEVQPSKTTSLLTSLPLSVEKAPSFNKIKATSLLLELHGGFTYTMINWFHFGAELSAPVFFSQSGFVTSRGNSITNGFATVNPGLKIRIIIGNIG